MRYCLPLIAVCLLQGCSFLNPMIGYERAFKWYVDEYIGNPLSKIEDDIRAGVWRKESSKVVMGRYLDVTLLLSYSPVNGEVECRWEARIDKRDNLVLSWRYISDRSECDWPFFYEGGW